MELYAKKVATRELCATAQCESLRHKLVGGLAVRKAYYGVVRFIMESGAKGCKVVVFGKLRGQIAKSMKLTDGFMIHSGYPIEEYIDMAMCILDTVYLASSQNYVAMGSNRRDRTKKTSA